MKLLIAIALLALIVAIASGCSQTTNVNNEEVQSPKGDTGHNNDFGLEEIFDDEDMTTPPMPG